MVNNTICTTYSDKYPLKSKPNHTYCPVCHRCIITRTSATPAEKAHLYAVLLCLLGCFPFCILPYCMHSCKNIHHYCPYCGAFIGTYNK
ncbi:hypothetical protein RN001_013800 [Aquatica leii]|uniref:LITAF domain-containing protein n=1 Tax=Aquatica leii TaxID=1421715 RepID=A0AAN7SNV7_9COLE|nr:hypothetical protein RN001_013800 [Aquatica leii]